VISASQPFKTLASAYTEIELNAVGKRQNERPLQCRGRLSVVRTENRGT